MAFPTRHTETPHATPPVINPHAPLPPDAPAARSVPDEGHPNAADKPFHERLSGGAEPAAAGTRKSVKDDKDD